MSFCIWPYPSTLCLLQNQFSSLGLIQILKKCPGTLVDITDNGWMTQDVFFTWFNNVFLKEVNNRPCILILDGHISHIIIKVIQKALEEKAATLQSPSLYYTYSSVH